MPADAPLTHWAIIKGKPPSAPENAAGVVGSLRIDGLLASERSEEEC